MGWLLRIVPPRVLGHPAVGATARRVFPRTDRILQRATGGRASLAAAAGMPLLLLETVGRRTGERRVTPLAYATRDAGSFLVAGSNWGQERQPGWVLNLLAAPQAVVRLRGRSLSVTARPLSGSERAQAWALLLEVWPTYDEYARRVGSTSAREIMVFRLERT